jgi:hypothetical protein
MRISKRTYLLFPIVALTITAAIAAANAAALKKWLGDRSDSRVATVNKKVKDPAQEAMMNELLAWLKPFDSSNTSYYLNGQLTAIDKIDSANALNEVVYTVCKNGEQLYLRIGQTEMINNTHNYLYVDHAVKKMLISQQRQLTQAPGLPVNELFEYITSEGFQFSKQRSDNRYTTITILNPKHISYKELSVQYDSVAKQVKKIFIRQAEVTDPMNADKEKWITLAIKDWNDDPDPSQYLGLQKYVQKKQDQWVPASGFQDYELINQ